MVEEETGQKSDTSLMTKNVWNIDLVHCGALVLLLEDQFRARRGREYEEILDIALEFRERGWDDTNIANACGMIRGWNSDPWNSFYDYLVETKQLGRAEKLVRLSYFHGVTLDVTRKEIGMYLTALLQATLDVSIESKIVLTQAAYRYGRFVGEDWENWGDISLRELGYLIELRHGAFWQEIKNRCSCVYDSELTKLFNSAARKYGVSV